MWIPRTVYETLLAAKTKAEAESMAVANQNAQLNAHIEWLRVMFTKAEYERAQLIQRYMGVSIPVPVFDTTTDSIDPNQTVSYADVGDTEAAKLGIEWNSDGTLKYTKQS